MKRKARITEGLLMLLQSVYFALMREGSRCEDEAVDEERTPADQIEESTKGCVC